MAIQMIFCLETNKRAGTDYIYIKEILNYLYQISNQVKISPVYMGTKTKYQSKDVLRQIAQKKKEYIHGETKVIYCIDTDEYEKLSQERLSEEEPKPCASNVLRVLDQYLERK